MQNNIRPNNHYNISSCIHEMNPIIKIVCSIFFIIIMVLAKTIWLNLILLVLLLMNIILTNIPIKIYLKILVKSLYVFIPIFLINIIFGMNITLNLLIIIKLIEILLYASLVTITTNPLMIVKSLSIMFWPLKFIGIPIYYVSFMIVFFVQYISNMFSLSKIINKSQRNKGYNSVFKKIFNKTIPLFVLSYENNKLMTDTLAIKLYDANWPKNYNMKLKIHFYDISILLFYIFIFILTLVEEV